MTTNDTRHDKVLNGSRGLRGANTPALDPNDPRHYRQTAQFLREEFVGAGLGIGPDGRLRVEPDEDTIQLVGEAAGSAQAAVFFEEAVGRTPADSDTGFARRLDVSTTAVDITDGTETSIYSYVIPPGSLVGSRMIRLRAMGYYTNPSGGAKTVGLKIKLGGTDIYADSTLTINAHAASRPVEVDIYIAALGSASSQKMWGFFSLGRSGTVAPTAGFGAMDNNPFMGNIICGVNAGSVIDMTAAQTAGISITLSSGTVNTFHSQYAYTEIT